MNIFQCNIHIYSYIFIIFIIIYANIYNTKASITCPSQCRVFATGSSSNHFNLLLLMIYRITVVESFLCVVIWNLGLSTYERKQLFSAIKYAINNGKNIHMHVYNFNYSKYPPHFNIKIDSGYYAWKPHVIYETYKIYKRSLLWLDSGCFIRNKLNSEYDATKSYKIWTISQGSTIRRYTHIDTLRILDSNKITYNKTMCAGGVIGLYYPSSTVDYIMQLWCACALIRKCLSPNGANLLNHRNDQSVISILLYQNNFSCIGINSSNFDTHFDKKYRDYKDKGFANYLNIIKKI